MCDEVGITVATYDHPSIAFEAAETSSWRTRQKRIAIRRYTSFYEIKREDKYRVEEDVEKLVRNPSINERHDRCTLHKRVRIYIFRKFWKEEQHGLKRCATPLCFRCAWFV